MEVPDHTTQGTAAIAAPRSKTAKNDPQTLIHVGLVCCGGCVTAERGYHMTDNTVLWTAQHTVYTNTALGRQVETERCEVFV